MDRGTLQQHLQRSRAVQRRVRWLGALGALVTLACVLADAPGMIVFAAVVTTAIVAAAGLWITQSHIHDFEQRLRM
jgi:hypothetical protein